MLGTSGNLIVPCDLISDMPLQVSRHTGFGQMQRLTLVCHFWKLDWDVSEQRPLVLYKLRLAR